mgnify:CR=1 FL=1
MVNHLTMPSIELFIDMNVVEPTDECFDEYFDVKRDFGKLVRRVTELIGFDRTFDVLMGRLDREIALAKEHPNNPVVWVNIHGVLVAIEQVLRNMDAMDLHKIERLLFIVFELPQDKIAFRLIVTEIIIDVSFCLGELAMDPTPQLIAETQKYFTYVIEGLQIKVARHQSALTLVKLVQKTKSYMHQFCD